YYPSVWKELKQVYYLLLLREVKTRFGRLKLGWVWIFLEPLLHTILLVAIRSLWSHRPILPDVPNTVYMLNSLIPWFLFRDISTRCTTAIAANKGLFVFSRIRPWDTVSARFIIEVFLSCFVYFSLMLGLWWFWDIVVFPTRIAEWFLSLFLLALLGLGLDGILASVALYFPEISKIKEVLFSLLYFTSGLFFVPSQMPPSAQFIFRWNPIALGIEYCKANTLESYPYIRGGGLFFLLTVLGTFIVGQHILNRHISKILNE
ncbi:MAG: ABC transporter permease, partial [Puniceicoccales bacterium]|nr:ABC transporter permease [Puniceicoccales bacterium]